jgi:hypothetical protein
MATKTKAFKTALNDIFDDYLNPMTTIQFVDSNEDRIFDSYILTTNHASSSYGYPVVVSKTTGDVFGAMDILPGTGRTAAACVYSAVASTEDIVKRFVRLGGFEPRTFIDGITGEIRT